MAQAILLLVLLVVAFLLVKSVLDAQQRARGGNGGAADRPGRARRWTTGASSPVPSAPSRPRARPRTRKPLKPVDEAKLTEHVAKLREAVEQDLISLDEAVASVVRHTDGQLSDEAARRLLQPESR
jgi:hypothetical protein